MEQNNDRIRIATKEEEDKIQSVLSSLTPEGMQIAYVSSKLNIKVDYHVFPYQYYIFRGEILLAQVDDSEFTDLVTNGKHVLDSQIKGEVETVSENLNIN